MSVAIRTAIYDLMNDVETDVYPVVAPQGLTDPYAVYSVRFEYLRTQDGTAVQDANMTVEIYANEYDDCGALADTIRGNVDNQDGTYNSKVLFVAYITSESDGYIPELDKFVITQEYVLRFN
jgi:hypothetical protein